MKNVIIAFLTSILFTQCSFWEFGQGDRLLAIFAFTMILFAVICSVEDCIYEYRRIKWREKRMNKKLDEMKNRPK